MTNTVSSAIPSMDPFYPSGKFSKVPAEALAKRAFTGATKMTHAEFRVFVAMCRFRGKARIVNPELETLQSLTGMKPNNISRATHGLQRKGWVTIHYVNPKTKRKVANYELQVPA